MSYVVGIAGGLLIASVLWDAFETILLPRRIPTRLRLSRAFLGGSWWLWRAVARRLAPRRRETLLSTYAILALLGLLAVWAISLMLGYALLQ